MWNHQQRSVKTVSGAYGLEVAVDNIHRMQVLQSAGSICELQGYSVSVGWEKSGDRAYQTKAVDLGVL